MERTICLPQSEHHEWESFLVIIAVTTVLSTWLSPRQVSSCMSEVKSYFSKGRNQKKKKSKQTTSKL